MAFFGELYLRSTRPFLAPEATAREAAFIASALALGPGVRALDIGCGHGRHLVPLRRAGHDVVGLDFDARSLAEVPSEHRAHVVRGDLFALPFGARFDAAFAWYATLFVRDEDEANVAALCEAARVLRPGGRLLVHGHNPAAQRREPESHFAATLDDGAQLVEDTWFDLATNVLHGRRVLRHGDRVLEGDFLVRCPTFEDHTRWAKRCALRLDAVFGNENGAALSERAPDLIVRYVKP